VTAVESGLMRRLRRERAGTDAEALVDAVLAALDVPEVQAKVRAIVGTQRSPAAAPSHRGGGGRRGR
jgi:hypothetical protein